MEDQEDPQPLKSFIGALVRHYRLQGKYNEARVQAAWKALMGDFVLERTKRLVLKEGVLFIELNSAPLREEVFMSRAELVVRINERVGAEVVREIRVS